MSKELLSNLRAIEVNFERLRKPLVSEFKKTLKKAENHEFRTHKEMTQFRDSVNHLLDLFEMRFRGPDDEKVKLAVTKKSPQKSHFRYSVPGRGYRGGTPRVPTLELQK